MLFRQRLLLWIHPAFRRTGVVWLGRRDLGHPIQARRYLPGRRRGAYARTGCRTRLYGYQLDGTEQASVPRAAARGRGGLLQPRRVRVVALAHLLYVLV